MRKIIWSLLLLLLGVVTVRAQVEPQISSGDDVYEYYMHFTQLNRYVESEYVSGSGNLKADGTLDAQSLRVKLVEGTDDYVRIVPINASGFESGYICSAGTSNGSSAIKFSNETTYSEWELSQQSDATPTYRLLLKGNNALAMSNYSSNNPHYRICDATNNHCNVRFIPANAKAAGITVDITSGRYYKIEAMRSGQTGTYLKNNANDATNRGNGSPLTNNYIWKVDVDELHLSLLNGQGSPLRVGTTDYPTMEILAGPPALAANTYAFSIYLHCNNYAEGIQIYSSAGTDENNQWKFVEVEGTPYEVVIDGGPEGATITRTVDDVKETAFDGGFFLTTEAELGGTFHGALIEGYAESKVTVNEEDKTVTVRYKAIDGVNAELHHAVAELNALVETAVAGPYVNCYSQEAINAARVAIGEAESKVWAGTATEADVDAVTQVMAELNASKIEFNPTGIYMVVNAARIASGQNKVLQSKDTDLRCCAPDLGENSQYWAFSPIDVDAGTYKLKNGDGTYVGGTPGTGNSETDNWFLMASAAEADTVKFTYRSDACYGMKLSNPTTGVFSNDMHAATSEEIVAWNDDRTTGASSWKLLPVQGEYNIYKVIISGDVPENATVTRTATEETAIDGGFFLYDTGTTPAAGDFTVTAPTPGRFSYIAIDNTAGTITVTYKRPVVPTTIEENGQFADGTQWYIMQIHGSKYVTDNGDADRIKLTGRSYGQDNEYWCFVANEDGSYKICNRAAGATRVLASSTTMSGTTGSGTYPTLREEAALPDGCVGSWVLGASSHQTNGMFIRLNDGNQYAMNDRDGYLAFWTGGADNGSTFILTPAEMKTTVSLETGAFSGSGSFHKTWTSSEFSGLTFSTGVNNMQADCDDPSLISCFTGGGCTYTLSAPSGYVIKSYSLSYKLRSDNANANVTINGVPATTELATLSDEDYNERTMSFEQSGDNEGVTLYDFNVVVARQVVPIEESYEVLPAPHNGVVHRIPAIAQAKNGHIIAVADYRYSGQDIGMATGEQRRLDLNFSISTDYGKTWNGVHTLIAGEGAPSDNLDQNKLEVAYGDPCIVVDRGTESDPGTGEVLVMSCAGNVSYPNGAPENHQYVVAMRSTDNGATWSSATDVTSQFYDKYEECTIGKPKAMFIGSGKISQSQYIKKDRYYRIYCAVLFKDEYSVEKNYVYYSDDFGTTWDVLGGVNVAPIPSGANEPKADELPDGSVVCSSRVGGGRKFNIFQYTDTDNAQGSWGTVANATKADNGPVDGSGGTNGEILTVPVKRKADGKKMFLFLQSVPLGPNRANVAIYYKTLESLADFDTAEHLASDWDGHYQACYFSSAYSTMTWLDNNTLGFLYEEDINGSAYSIVYKNYTIEKLTGDQYEYCDDVDESVMIKSSLNERLETVKGYVGPYVGNLTSAGYLSIEDAYNTYMEATSPTKFQYATFNKAVADAPYHTLEAGREYRVHNKAYPTKYLTIQASGENPKVTVAELNEGSAAQKLTFSAGSVDGRWVVKGDAAWLGKTGNADGDGVALETAEDEAVDYEVVSDKYGLSYFRCLSPENTAYPCLHVNSGHNVVRWNSIADASQWYIKPATESAAEQIDDILIDCKDELAMAGKVGAPKADNVNVATFQEAFDDAKAALIGGSATGDDWTALTAARDAYRAVTDVQMPEAGKAYRIRNVKYSETAPTYRTVYMTGAASKALESGHEDHDDAEIFVCAKDAAGHFAFHNVKYGSAISCRGVSDSYNANIAAFELQTMNNRDFSGVMPPVGGFSFKTISRNANGGGNPGALIANHGADTFRDAGDTNEPFYSTSWSTIYVLEEVPDYRNKMTFTKLNEDDFYICTYSAPYATVLPEGVKAYAAVSKGDGVVQTVTVGDAGDAIPANTGVMLASRTAIDPQHMAPATIEPSVEIPEDNKLKPYDAPTEGGSTYILSMQSTVVNSVGFYEYDVATKGVGTYRAYLEMPAASGRALRIIFSDDIETGIDSIEGTENISDNTAIYDLSGRRVLRPVKGGLYIKGGVKYVHQ